MKLKTTYISLISLLTLSSCSSDLLDIINPDNWGKTPISLSASAEQTGSFSRAGFTSANTRIIAKIKSEKESENATETEWTVASLLASKDNDNNSESYSAVDYKLNESRFWDDTYGREAKVSVYAIAIADQETTLLNNETLLKGVSAANPWIKQTAENNADNLSFNFSVASDQNAVDTKCANYDLVYSNNIVKKSDEDNRLWFGHKDAGKFEKGQLHFNHALTKITVNLVSGEGFVDDNDFTADNTSVAFGNNVFKANTSGTFNIATGSWSNLKDEAIINMATANIVDDKNKVACISNCAIMMPGLVVTKANDQALTIIVDSNSYHVSQELLLKALKASKDIPADDKPASTATEYTLKQGKHYIFTINLNKTKVCAVRATLANWESVTGSVETTNARISISVSQAEGKNACNDVALYRLRDAGNTIITDEYVGKQWSGNYGTAATLTPNDENKKYSTNWFFDDNTSYYHFRTVKKDTEINYSANVHDDSYFTISCGTRGASDPHWGAPMGNATTTYSSDKGFSNIYQAIGPTLNDIDIIEQHMLSQINVQLNTTSGDDKVNLEDAQVVIENMYHQGHVLMGNGRVVPVTTSENAKADVVMTAPTGEETNFTYDVVPQVISRNNENVQLIITTKDNQKYVVNLSDVKNIPDWKPGHQYTYTFTLKKTGIANISVSLAPWQTEKASGDVWL